MVSRTALRQTAIATLMAVLFVVLLPAAISGTGKFSVASIPGMTEICTLAGIKLNADAPAPEQPMAHQPCMFCTSSVPVFADAYSPRLTAVVDGIPVTVGPAPAAAPPRDSAATQPLSPRAPPRAN